MEMLPVLTVVLSICILIFCVLIYRRSRKDALADQMFRQALQDFRQTLTDSQDRLEQHLADESRMSREEMARELRAGRQENDAKATALQHLVHETLTQNMRTASDLQASAIAKLSQELSVSLESYRRAMTAANEGIDQRIHHLRASQEEKLEAIRTTMENRLAMMQAENGLKLDEMRATVDEKLQKTLEERIGQSFKMVSERLEQVYKGLGEMQNLAVGVGDLKKVLSNVKTRGVLGEIQLGSILEQMLSPEQYAANVCTKKGSRDVVEYAVKLPGSGENTVWLPIDAKFPADAYHQLVDAYDTGDPAAIEAASGLLNQRIKKFAKDIRDKYLDPPGTTDFAVMFLPFEGLYAEVVRRDMVEILQRDYKVNIAGPTTMAALLNSLQMGFKTLAIQKRTSEVWQVLGAVKNEFDKFGSVLAQTQQRLEQANSELDKLVGVRTRQIQKRLRSVTSLPDGESAQLLDTIDGELGESYENPEENPS